MNTNKVTTGMDTKIKLSLLWIFVLFNMLYADIISLMDDTSPFRKILDGDPMPSAGLLAAAILMETPIVMIIMSWLVSYKVNRWVNIIIATINIVAVIDAVHGLYGIFFTTVEVACMLLIIWFAWKWNNSEGASKHKI